MFPDMSVGDFSGEPTLLCSIPNRSAFSDKEEAFADSQFTIEAPPCGWAGTRLIAVTDALAEWVVRSENSAERLEKLEILAGQPDRVAFSDWAARAITAGHVRRDDCSMLLLGL